MSGKIVNSMDTLSFFGLIICHMKDMSTRTNYMLLGSFHGQMEDIMMVNGIIMNSMGTEFRNCQMEIFMKDPIRRTNNTALVS